MRYTILSALFLVTVTAACEMPPDDLAPDAGVPAPAGVPELVDVDCYLETGDHHPAPAEPLPPGACIEFGMEVLAEARVAEDRSTAIFRFTAPPESAAVVLVGGLYAIESPDEWPVGLSGLQTLPVPPGESRIFGAIRPRIGAAPAWVRHPFGLTALSVAPSAAKSCELWVDLCALK